MLRVLLALALLIAPLSATAQIGLTGAGGYYPVSSSPPPSYTGPGDIVSFTAWYGLRAYDAAIVTAGTQALANFRRASDSVTCDVIVSATGGLGVTANCSTGLYNGLTPAVFCAATTCYITELYDQTGGGRPILQATAADQPTVVFSCLGSFPCFQGAAMTILLASSSNYTPGNGTVSFSGVSFRVEGTNAFYMMAEDGTGTSLNRLSSKSDVANQWLIGGTSGSSLAVTATDSVWHAANAVVNGASSVFNLDGAETTGTVNGVTTAGEITWKADSLTSETVEIGFQDEGTFSSGNRTSLCRNQQAYYTASNFGASC